MPSVRQLWLTPAVLALSLVTAGCATMPTAACESGSNPQRLATMVFGRNVSSELGVSEAQFRAFVDQEVGPRFPNGLTILDAEGRWGPDVREPSKLVLILLPGRSDDHAQIGAIARAYEQRFRQEAVLSMVQPACASLWLAKPAPPAGVAN